MTGNSSRLLREPLTHFFAIGLLLFLLYGFLNRGGFDAPNEIVVDQDTVTALQARFARTWQRQATESELRGLVDNWIREEILYREGLAMRLDQDDPVVRRRIAQKMDFISDGLVPSQLDDAELQAWLDAHPDDYRIPDRYTLRQVYFDPSRHGEALASQMEQMLIALAAGSADSAGDPTLLPEWLDDLTAHQVARVFGSEFATALGDLPLGVWAGPVTSGYGMHLVLLQKKQPGRMPALDEVRNAVERDLLRARTEQADEAFYEILRQKYTVSITADPQAAVPGPGS